MYRNGATLPIVVLFSVLVTPVFPSLPPQNATQPTPDNPSTAPFSNTTQFTDPFPMCSVNETLYSCSSQHNCCQSQSNALVQQLEQIKAKFKGVDSIIRKDYQNIQGEVERGLTWTKGNLSEKLGETYSLLLPAFNTTLDRLYHLFLGHDKSDNLDSYIRGLSSQILHTILSKTEVPGRRFPRSIKGINIFWELNTVQRSCVVDYMIRSTNLDKVTDEVTRNMRNSTQSLHEYMSLLGTMVTIIENMVKAQQTRNCIDEIVKMQQCSLCTETPVCPEFYKQLLSGCVPQLEELYKRWDNLMSAMSELTLRLCEHDLDTLYSHVFLLSEFIVQGKLEDIIYEHGVLAYMRCVQPDSHKRSTGSLAYSRSQESMVPEERLSNVPNQLLSEEYVYHEGSSNGLLSDMKLSRRSVSDPVTQPPFTTSSPKSAASHLPKCREKLGLNFPPLDLGTTTSLLNISISLYNLDCWNGSEIGSYIVDQTISSKSTARPEALAIKELDEKMCKYARECQPPEDPPPFNNSHHGPSVLQVLASLVASMYYCCC